MKVSELYIVATPIGNLSDITLRALDTLKSVDIIACEDTRHSIKLLNAHGVSKKLISCRSQNEKSVAKKIISFLEDGKNVAYLSDAGTPGISDPGVVLVSIVRDAGFKVTPIPGPSAMSALISVSGFTGGVVLFEGFLSPKSEKKKKRLEELLERGENFIIYESPFRVIKLLECLKNLAPSRKVLVGREMTKIFEEFVSGTANEVYNNFMSRKQLKGEFSIIVSGKKKV